MEMMPYQFSRLPYQDSLKLLEVDIEHANSLAAAIPRCKGESLLQMKLVYNQLAPLILLFQQWMDCSCVGFLHRYFNLFHILIYKVQVDGRSKMNTHGRRATIGDFYAVILPSLQRLHGSAEKLKISEEYSSKEEGSSTHDNKMIEGDRKLNKADLQREEECGICLEPCSKMVLPNCCHDMCIRCYRKWNTMSESCPFCRGSLRRVNSEDLWVLTCDEEVVDAETVAKEDLWRFYLFINNLPNHHPDYNEEGGKPLPKFGEWDVNDPASAEGFTVIFNKARDDKKLASASGRFPSQRSKPHQHKLKLSSKKKWFCFVPSTKE